MQVIAPRSVRRGPSRTSVALGMAVGTTLLAGGIAVAWLTFGTPFIGRFTPSGRPETTQIAAGMLAWAFALIAPATFIIAGVARIASVVDGIVSARSAGTPLRRLGRLLGDDILVATRVPLPDGRVVPQLVIGPFGAAVLEQLPPPGAARHRGGTAWEVRTADGRWTPIENPLDRATRDAEGVRRLLGDEDREFVVKVYAAVLARDTTVPRTPSCAVITPPQIPAWLASLPAQRSLTPERRKRLRAVLLEAR